MGLWENALISLAVGLLLLYLTDRRAYRRGIEHTQDMQVNAIKSIKKAIFAEVESNEQLLDKTIINTRYGHRIYLDRLFQAAFDSATSTDNFISLPTEIQTPVKFYYGGIDRWNALLNKLDGEKAALTIQDIFAQQTRLKFDLLKATKDLKELLKSEE